LDVTEAEADKLLSTLNLLASLAQADRDVLRSLLAELYADLSEGGPTEGRVLTAA
jgi:hypothetical protein